MAIQTSFAKKMTWSQDCNHRFLALLGNDSELDLALLDVKNRVRNIALRENNLILPVFEYFFSLTHLGEQCFRIERELSYAFHSRPSFIAKDTVTRVDRRKLYAKATSDTRWFPCCRSPA